MIQKYLLHFSKPTSRESEPEYVATVVHAYFVAPIVNRRNVFLEADPESVPLAKLVA
jgi:hypothetical protein